MKTYGRDTAKERQGDLCLVESQELLRRFLRLFSGQVSWYSLFLSGKVFFSVSHTGFQRLGTETIYSCLHRQKAYRRIFANWTKLKSWCAKIFVAELFALLLSVQVADTKARGGGSGNGCNCWKGGRELGTVYFLDVEWILFQPCSCPAWKIKQIRKCWRRIKGFRTSVVRSVNVLLWIIVQYFLLMMLVMYDVCSNYV